MVAFFYATLTVVQKIATVVQKIALTAIIDQVHNSNICAGPRQQAAVWAPVDCVGPLLGRVLI